MEFIDFFIVMNVNHVTANSTCIITFSAVLLMTVMQALI